eukprot:GFYU01026769.1.p1 GENE.GFYU01026769.1~~GFYU01026769.1.p1  ORF type:complete len:459 (-),score=61.12 GFYU01026769.1:179-1555(-)
MSSTRTIVELLTQLSCVLATFYGAYWYLYRAPHARMWSHSPTAVMHNGEQHAEPYVVFDPFFTSEKDLNSVLKYAKRQKYLSVNTADTRFSKHSHIGEAEPVGEDGSCKSDLLTLDESGKTCIFPARMDAAYHHILSGGVNAMSASVEKTVGRINTFQNEITEKTQGAFDLDEFVRVFAKPEFEEQSVRICGGDRPVFGHVINNIIILLPGQEMPLHYDPPWFFGADLRDLPMWLLVAMASSGLFEEYRVPQVQGVAYIHPRKNVEVEKGGLWFYPNNTMQEPVVVPAQSNTAVIINGDRVVHGIEPYRPEDELPSLDKDIQYSLRCIGKDQWHLRDGPLKKGSNVLRTYTTDELRIAFVWRLRCFRDDAELNRFERKEKPLSLEFVLDTFQQDLVTRGRLQAGQEVSRYELGRAIIDEYVHYPFNRKKYFPYNICGLGVYASWLQPLLHWIHGCSTM